MKKILAMFLSLLIIFTLVACGGDPSSSDNPTNSQTSSSQQPGGEGLKYAGMTGAFLVPTLSDSFLVTITEKVTALAAADGLELTSFGADGNLDTQLQQFENAVSMGSDLIILVPLNVDAFENAVTQARERGVKVMLCSDDPTWNADILWLSVAEVIGEMVAEMAIEWANQTFPDAGPGEIKVCWLTTSLERPDAYRRCYAMHDRLMEDDRFTLVFRKDDVLDAADAMTAMQECLTVAHDINVVITYADTMGIGCNSAIMADSTLDWSQIGIFSGSSTAEAEQLVDMSVNNESVLRGVVTFGPGDTFYEGYWDCASACLDELYPEDYALFQMNEAYNHFGYQSSFDPEEYAKTYQNNGH